MVPLLLLLAACPQPEPTPSDDTDETDPVDTDDTDAAVETGWLDTDPGDDSGIVDTDTDPSDSDSDTGQIGDTGGCSYGEIRDCQGTCYPAWFLGDGTCDDGTTFASDFNCPSYVWDAGDCEGPVIQTCEYIIRADVRADPGEYGWTLRSPDGIIVAEVRPGTYLDEWRIYDHPIDLPSGTYTVLKHDEMGDGWGGATWQLIDANNGAVQVSGTFARPPDFDPLNPGPRSDAQQFDLTCGTPPPSCDVLVDVYTATHGAEVGWQLRTTGGFVLRSGAPGTLGDFDRRVTTVNLQEGVYNFRMTDGGSGGWEGGHVELTHAGGYAMGFGALVGFSSGGFNFTVDCDQDTAPPISAPVGPIPVTCGALDLRVVGGSDGPDVGFTLYDTTTWAALVSRDPGFFWAGTTTTVDAPLPASGRYMLVVKDGAGNGWGATSARFFDAATGADLFTPTLPYGHMAFVPFEVACTDIVPEDTADTDLPPPPGPCPAGAVLDCDGVCWPESYRDDGFCDDGTVYAPDFMCAALGWDGGDCRP